MFYHLAVAPIGATLLVSAGWEAIGCGALLLAPLGGSLASLGLGLVLFLHGRGTSACGSRAARGPAER